LLQFHLVSLIHVFSTLTPCNSAPQVDEAGPSKPVRVASDSTHPPVEAVAVNYADAKLSPEDPWDDFGRDDAWRFLNNWKKTMEDYGEEYKKTHGLGERLVATEAVLQGTEDALAGVKQQLVDSDSMIAGNRLSFC
jgi:hypothetical protein